MDALFGFSFKGPPGPQFADILGKLKQVEKEVPICSIDVPSGKTGVICSLDVSSGKTGVIYRLAVSSGKTGVICRLDVS